MNPEIKALWVTALRSGEYNQGTGVLRRSGDKGNPAKYCCLGVLCDLYAKEKGIDGWNGETDSFLEYLSFPPVEVRDWAGISGGAWCGEFEADNESVDVVTMNDIENNTFSEIADAIERLD